MKNILPIILLLLAKSLCAQFCTNDDRFTEVPYFQDTEITSLLDVVYGNALDWQGNPVDLTLDVYYPTLSVDPMAKRPFVLMVHGGGFVSGSKEGLRADCEAFAERGFVAATIKYRLGYNNTIPSGIIAATYRAQQDARAALRFVVETSNLVGVDTAWMFMGGNSAGAVTSLNVNYVTEAEYETAIPGITSLLGGLDNSGNNFTHPFTLKGIFNNWGSTAGFAIEPHEMIPMIAFHGALDQVVEIDITADDRYGSRAIHTLLSNNGVCSDLSVDELGGHGIYNSSLRRERASCFFKSIFCNDCAEFYSLDPIAANCSTVSANLPPDIFVTQNDIELLPSPVVTNQFTIEGSLDLYSLEIRDATGMVYRSIDTYGKSYTIDVSNLPAGLYFIKITNNSNGLIEMQTIIKD